MERLLLPPGFSSFTTSPVFFSLRFLSPHFLLLGSLITAAPLASPLLSLQHEDLHKKSLEPSGISMIFASFRPLVHPADGLWKGQGSSSSSLGSDGCPLAPFPLPKAWISLRDKLLTAVYVIVFRVTSTI